jgi:hypothetical protein
MKLEIDFGMETFKTAQELREITDKRNNSKKPIKKLNTTWLGIILNCCERNAEIGKNSYKEYCGGEEDDDTILIMDKLKELGYKVRYKEFSGYWVIEW